MVTSTTQVSSSYEVIRTSNPQVYRPSSRNVVQFSESHRHTVFLTPFYQRPLAPLKLPAVFSAPATSDSHASRPGEGPSAQAIQVQVSAPAPHLGPSSSSVDREERHVEKFVRRQNSVIGYSTGSVTSTLLQTSSLTGQERPHTLPAASGSLPSQLSQPPMLRHSTPAYVPPPPELPPLLSGKIVLPRRVISHNKTVQERMEQLKISWGVQYELARGELAGKWTWGDITDNVLRQLRGPNAQAASRVSAVVFGGSILPPTESSLNLW